MFDLTATRATRFCICNLASAAVLAAGVTLASASPAPGKPKPNVNVMITNPRDLSKLHNPGVNALNPQPLPPDDNGHHINALNPQPLPPAPVKPAGNLATH